MELGPWRGRALPDLSDNARNMLRVDDYINRSYYQRDGSMVELYVGYHSTGGSTPH